MVNGRDTLIPIFDFQGRRQVGSNTIKSISSGVVGRLVATLLLNLYISSLNCFSFSWLQIIVDGTYALHARLRSLLDIRVAVVTIIYSVSNYRIEHIHLPVQNLFLYDNVYSSHNTYFYEFNFLYAWRNRLVVFILVCFPKFNMILVSLVRWITSSTAFFLSSLSILSQTSIMHRLVYGILV